MNAVEYWDKGARNVPDMTGARALLDAHDLRDICGRFGMALPLPGLTVDVGCGTGRAAQLCERYVGFDVAPSAVEYCRGKGREAHVLAAWTQNERIHEITHSGGAQQVLCVSVFTHIPRSERIYYLQCFAQLAPRLLVDIIPGNGGGDIALWTARPEEMEEDLRHERWKVLGTLDYVWDADPVQTDHRFYLAELAS